MNKLRSFYRNPMSELYVDPSKFSYNHRHNRAETGLKKGRSGGNFMGSALKDRIFECPNPEKPWQKGENYNNFTLTARLPALNRKDHYQYSDGTLYFRDITGAFRRVNN